MKLNAPTQLVFIISLVVIILGILGVLLTLPMLTDFAPWILTLGYAILAGGTLMKGM